MLPETLKDWLEYIERQHPAAIAMGLDRVAAVRDALALKPVFPLITVGGTNGKGSTCRLLDAMLMQAGYRVGTYTSPHLLLYNERVRIGGQEAADADLVRAFAAVEAARVRLGLPLTYFEFGTLAALWLFVEAGVDAAVLEIGLGGRLDAVNAFDPDVSVLVSIGMDHMEYLGDTRDKIGWEKAHIFRTGRTAICADAQPPATVIEHAAVIGAPLLLIGRDFGYQAETQQWRYRGPRGVRHGLPPPALRGPAQLANACAAITALDLLRERLPVSAGAIRAGLVHVENPGRFQVLPGRPAVVLDVAHNPHAAEALALNLVQMTGYQRTLAVFSMLADKDVAGVARCLRGHVDHWYVAPLPGPRGSAAEPLLEALRQAGITAPVEVCPDIENACQRASRAAGGGDRILAFGSFLTVAAAMTALRHRGNE
ncbi:MAG: bifunctional tetrahydrofolate synthase/dihydrofolate synthase [Betaproteobacteria bacterium]|jgi:dihydrofolate synthase/folylpolyglutamate synthase|nr:bifunctional tetrahydrofolate synthase/dihydrofolate synthase [Betaproteobacteria bacterium]